MTTVPGRRIRGRRLDLRRQGAPVLRIEPRRERGRTDEVAEHHGDGASLGGGRRCGGRPLRWSGRWGASLYGRGRFSSTEAHDRCQKPLAIAKGHADLSEVAVGQIRQDVPIDRVFAKGFVLCEAFIEKPVPNVHRCLHTPLKDNRPAAARCKGRGWGRQAVSTAGQTAAPVNPTPSAEDRFLALPIRSWGRILKVGKGSKPEIQTDPFPKNRAGWTLPRRGRRSCNGLGMA